jgi:spore coat protein E
MANTIREIITKAIIAKGKRKSRNKYTFEIADVTKVLGCWITNHEFNASFNADKVEVKGTYDVHIWYCFEQESNSNIYKTKIEYVENIDVHSEEERIFSIHDEVQTHCEELPKCMEVELMDALVTLDIEKEIQVRVIGETCIRVETKEEDNAWSTLEEFEINENFIT